MSSLADLLQAHPRILLATLLSLGVALFNPLGIPALGVVLIVGGMFLYNQTKIHHLRLILVIVISIGFLILFLSIFFFIFQIPVRYESTPLEKVISPSPTP